MSTSRRTFTREFKVAAVKRLQSGVPVGRVARKPVGTCQVTRVPTGGFFQAIRLNRWVNLLSNSPVRQVG